MATEPTFMLCLGATKAGTSWLYSYLYAHPECHLRTIKELHYFRLASPEQFDAARLEAEEKCAGLQARLATAEPEKRAYLALQIQDLKDWQAVLALRQIDMAAYRDFLLKGADRARLVGEVTPAYALLPVEKLQALTKLAADTRFIYLMRDPLSRLWSNVRMTAARKSVPADFARNSRALMRRVVEDHPHGAARGIADRSDYAGVIKRIKAAIPAENLLVQFQEVLMTPAGIAEVTQFLGLSPVAADLDRRVHEGQALDLPVPLRKRALAWLRPQYEFVASLFPVLPEAWRKNMEEGFA